MQLFFISANLSTLLVVGREVNTLQGKAVVPWPAVVELDLTHKTTEEEARG